VWSNSNNAIVGPVKKPKGPAFDAAVSTASPADAASTSAIDNDDDANTSCNDWSCNGNSWTRCDGSIGANDRAVVVFDVVAVRLKLLLKEVGVNASTPLLSPPPTPTRTATKATTATFIVAVVAEGLMRNGLFAVACTTSESIA
jgi:hypothetical protein